MGCRLCLVVCLAGCGLTLDLDEPMDASTRDTGANEQDSGPLPEDSGTDAIHSPDGGPGDTSVEPRDGGPVEPGDVGIDAPLTGCEPACGPGRGCSGGVCQPLCGGEVCYDGLTCVSGACELCDPNECPSGHVCEPDGGCVCAGGICLDSEQCSPTGDCVENECERDSDCVDPVGAGCRTYYCSTDTNRTCVSVAREIPDCQYCDPRTGDTHFFDRDGDGFVECSMCSEDGDRCDCNDRNPFINPDAFDGPALNRNCDDEIDPPTAFCVIDSDMDGSPVVERAELGRMCPSGGMFVNAGSLIDAGGTLPLLDCDDDNVAIFPQQTSYSPSAIGGAAPCEPARGQCFDYNCDGRHEREYPAFARCRRASTPVACTDAGGWDRAGEVPACGERADLILCRWEPAAGCLPMEAMVGKRQSCR